MKTKTTNQVKIGANTNTRNFFQKTFVLLAILVFTGFSFNLKARGYRVTVVNNSSCTFTYEGVDGGGITLWGPISVTASSSNNSGCKNYSDGISTIVVKGANCTNVTFTLLGGFPETLSTSCVPSCGTGVVVCSETTSFVCLTPPLVTAEILITIN